MEEKATAVRSRIGRFNSNAPIVATSTDKTTNACEMACKTKGQSFTTRFFSPKTLFIPPQLRQPHEMWYFTAPKASIDDRHALEDR